MEKRLLWIDCLRVLACFGVVWLHSGAILLDDYAKLSGFDWWTLNIYLNSVRCRIPLFLMISGAVILPKVYDSLGEYLHKRVSRLVWPALFWSLAYLLMHFYSLWSRGLLATVDPLTEAYVKLRDGVYYHFWYIYMVIGLSLFFPILGRWIRGATGSEIRYFIAIWAVTLVATIPVVAKLMPSIELQYFAGYVGYPVLGYYIRTREWKNPRRARRLGLAMFLAAGATVVAATHIVSHARGELWTGLLGNLNPVVAAMGAGVFLLFRNLDFDGLGAGFASTVRFLGRYSYGIYLVHAKMFSVILRLGIDHSLIHPAVGIPITAVVCFAFSAAVVWAVNKIPWIGKYISG